MKTPAQDIYSKEHAFEDGNDPLLNEKISFLAARYKFNPLLARRLAKLKGFQIVLLLDDSYSMTTPTDTKNRRTGLRNSRWTELIEYVETIIDIATVFDEDGIDIYFLNRDGRTNVKSMTDVIDIFETDPHGGTPLNSKVTSILKHYSKDMKAGKKMLLLIVTDGEPTDCARGNWNPQKGRYDVDPFFDTLAQRKVHSSLEENNPIVIRVCTDNDEEVASLQHYDENVGNLDVVDDYRSEKKEIREIQGWRFPFKYPDYILKSLLGGIDKWFDNLDEVRLTGKERGFARRGKITNSWFGRLFN
jgi:hypothetical protein